MKELNVSHIKILNPPLNINNIFDIKDKKFEKKYW